MTTKSKTFQEVAVDNFQQLDLYTTAIARVHGKSHPEAYQVRELFERIQSKVKAMGDNKADLNAEFSELREVTRNYQPPRGVCGTYINVYETLQEVDAAYHVK